MSATRIHARFVCSTSLMERRRRLQLAIVRARAAIPYAWPACMQLPRSSMHGALPFEYMRGLYVREIETK